MPLALILSSYAAADRIGGGAQQFALAACGIDPVLIPTILLGASPAKGGRGQAVALEVFAALLAGAAPLLDSVDLIITGYFASAEQVVLAAAFIGKARDDGRRPLVVVDPIMGDAPKGLYVKPDVARALQQHLVPLADWITPNLWELSHLTGRQIDSAVSVAEAALALGRPALVTSAPAGAGEIGLMCVQPLGSILLAHRRREGVANGTGDLVTAIFAANLVLGETAFVAAERAAGAAAMAVDADVGLLGLPLMALGARLANPDAIVRLEVLA